MSTTPRIIASAASAALLAAAGAGAAVFAIDTISTGQDQNTVDATTTDTLQSPKDDGTTVYRSPQDDSSEGGQRKPRPVQPAPPTTTWQGGNGQKTPGNTSKSS